MSRVTAILYRHYATLLGFAVGALFAALVFWRLGFTLTAGAPEVLVSVITVVGTLGGAIAIWRLQEARKEEQLGLAIIGAVVPTVHSISNLVGTIDLEIGQEAPRTNGMRIACFQLETDLAETAERLSRHHSATHLLAVGDSMRLITIEKTLKEVARIGNVVRTRMGPAEAFSTGAWPQLLNDRANLVALYNSVVDDIVSINGAYKDQFDDLVANPSV